LLVPENKYINKLNSFTILTYNISEPFLMDLAFIAEVGQLNIYYL